EFASSFIMIIASYFIINWMLPTEWYFKDPLYAWADPVLGNHYTAMGIFWATVIGLVGGVLVGLVTEYYTGMGKRPVVSTVRQSATGASRNSIAALGVGMVSPAIPILLVAVASIGACSFGGEYGSAIGAVVMLCDLGIQVAVDAYG